MASPTSYRGMRIKVTPVLQHPTCHGVLLPTIPLTNHEVKYKNSDKQCASGERSSFTANNAISKKKDRRRNLKKCRKNDDLISATSGTKLRQLVSEITHFVHLHADKDSLGSEECLTFVHARSAEEKENCRMYGSYNNHSSDIQGMDRRHENLVTVGSAADSKKFWNDFTRCQNLKPGDIPFIQDGPQKEEQTGERQPCRRSDKERIPNLHKTFSSAGCNSQKSSKGASKTEPYKSHRSNIKSIKAAEFDHNTKSKNDRSNCVAMVDSFRKKHISSTKEGKFSRNAGNGSGKDNAHSPPSKNKLISVRENKFSNNNTVRSLDEINPACSGASAQDAFEENASPKEKKVSPSRSLEKIASVPELVSETVGSGPTRISNQLNKKKIKMNLSELALRHRDEESAKERRSPKTKHIEKTMQAQIKEQSKTLRDTVSKSPKTDRDNYVLPTQVKHGKRQNAEEIFKLKKRKRPDEATGSSEKWKRVKRKVLTKFRDLFGESTTLSEDEEDRRILRMRKRRKKDSVDSSDSGFGIDENRISPKEVCFSKEVQHGINCTLSIQQAVPDSTKQDIIEHEEESALNSENSLKVVSKESDITEATGLNQGLTELITDTTDQEGENANSFSAKNCQDKNASSEQLISKTYQVEKCLSDSNVSCTETVSATDSIHANLQTTDVCSSTIDILNAVDNNADSSEKNYINLIDVQVPENDVITDSPESNATTIVLSPISEEVTSGQDIFDNANNFVNIPNETDSITAPDSSESCETVVSTTDVNGKEPPLLTSSNECAQEMAITEKDTTKVLERTTYSPDTSSNVQNLSKVISKEANSMDDIYELLQMGLDKNYEIISNGNTVHISQNITMNKDRPVICQESKESDIAQMKIVEGSQSDSSHITDTIGSNDVSDIVVASIANATKKEKDSVKEKEIVESVQPETATSNSAVSDAETLQVPEKDTISGILSTETVSTDKTEVPTSKTPRLRVLSSGELGSRWCPTPAFSEPVVSTEKSLPYSVASNTCVNSEPPTVPPASLANNPKDRLMIVLENVVQTVKYLRYLREKNKLDKRIPDSHIRQKQMEQNLADFTQSTVQFRAEFNSLGSIFDIEPLELSIHETVYQLNLHELRERPLTVPEFQFYWRFTPKAKVISNMTNDSTANNSPNVSSSAPINESVNRRLETSVTSTCLQYTSGSMTNNVTPTISSSAAYQYNPQHTHHANQQCRISPVNNVPTSTYQQPQGVPVHGRTLVEEQSAFLPTPVAQYNDEMDLSQQTVPQNTGYVLTNPKRYLQESKQRKAQWCHTQSFVNPNLQNVYVHRKSPPPLHFSQPRVPLAQPLDQFANRSQLIVPPQHPFYPAYNIQRPIANQYPSQVQPQRVPTQEQSTQNVGQSQKTVQGNARTIMSQTMVNPQIIGYSEQSMQHGAPPPIQRNLQTNIHKNSQKTAQNVQTKPKKVQKNPQVKVNQNIQQDPQVIVNKNVQQQPQTNVQQTRQQHIPNIQSTFVNVTVQTQKAPDVSRSITRNVERTSNRATIHNVPYTVPLINHQSLALQNGAKPAQAPGTATYKENMPDPNVTSAQSSTIQHTECFSILQNIMLRTQIETCLSFPVENLKNYLNPSEVYMMNRQRVYLYVFHNLLQRYLSNYTKRYGANTLSGQSQQNEGNIMRGSNNQQGVTDATDLSTKNCTEKRRRRRRKKRDQNINKTKQQEKDTNLTKIEDSRQKITDLEIRPTVIRSTEATGKVSNDDPTTRMSLPEQKSIQESKKQLNVPSTTQAVPLEDMEKSKSSPDATTSGTQVPKRLPIGRSLPVLDETVPDTSRETLNAKELNSQPVLRDNLLEDTRVNQDVVREASAATVLPNKSTLAGLLMLPLVSSSLWAGSLENVQKCKSSQDVTTILNTAATASSSTSNLFLNISTSNKQLNAPVTSQEVPLKNREKFKSSRDATTMSQTVETAPLRKELEGTSLPVLDETVTVNSGKTLNAEELYSQPAVRENSSEGIQVTVNDIQEVLDTTTLSLNISTSREQLNIASISQEEPLVDGEKCKPSKDAMSISDTVETVAPSNQTDERSLPVIGKIVPATSQKTFKVEEFNSKPVLHANLSEDSMKVLNNSVNVSNSESDEQSKSLLSQQQQLQGESTLPNETSSLTKEKSVNSNTTTKQIHVSSSSANESEKTAPKLQINLVGKPVVHTDIANTELNTEKRVQEVTKEPANNYTEELDLNLTEDVLETSIASPSLQSINSQSTDVLSEQNFDSEFIQLEDLPACEFQPNILDVRSITLNTFTHLEDMMIIPQDKLLFPVKKMDSEDEMTMDEGSGTNVVQDVHVEEDVKICLYCARRSTVLCGGCLIAHYCSKDCHELHWEEHFSNCKLQENLHSQS